ncbi:MAG: lipopolysaccharide biosynthesis protein, partial [Streptococcus sp.]|nr:lipopolysaccharide biosynthesis protein [Streptococcus sp.]
MSKQGKYKQLFSNSILYSIGNFGSSAVSFLLLPLYTNALTTGQYGYIDIIQTLIDLLLPVLSLNFADSILRYTLDGKH